MPPAISSRGSQFPGSVSYSKAYNAKETTLFPGLPIFVTHGNSDNFGVNWSENLPDKPSLSAGLPDGEQPVFRVRNQRSGERTRFIRFNLHSGYNVAGFNMGAYYINGGGHSRDPAGRGRHLMTEHSSDNNAFGFNVAHPLPMQGSVVGWLQSLQLEHRLSGLQLQRNLDMVNSLAAVHPTNKLSVYGNLNYSDNLAGQSDPVGHRRRRRRSRVQLQPILEFPRHDGRGKLRRLAQPADLRLRRAPHPVLPGRILWR